MVYEHAKWQYRTVTNLNYTFLASVNTALILIRTAGFWRRLIYLLQSCQLYCQMSFKALTQDRLLPVFTLVKTCDPPSTPTNAMLSSCTRDYDYDSVCVFQCVDGYGMAPGSDRSIQCTAEGTWEGTISECLGKNE